MARSVRHILRHTLLGTSRAYEGASANLNVRVMGRRLYLVQMQVQSAFGVASLFPEPFALPWSPRNLLRFLLSALIFASGLVSRAGAEPTLQPISESPY